MAGLGVLVRYEQDAPRPINNTALATCTLRDPTAARARFLERLSINALRWMTLLPTVWSLAAQHHADESAGSRAQRFHFVSSKKKGSPALGLGP